VTRTVLKKMKTCQKRKMRAYYFCGLSKISNVDYMRINNLALVLHFTKAAVNQKKKKTKGKGKEGGVRTPKRSEDDRELCETERIRYDC
jgi:hypothetical protein